MVVSLMILLLSNVILIQKVFQMKSS
ncbi:hypothetical protein Gotur_000228 [Gossypium turneri]